MTPGPRSAHSWMRRLATLAVVAAVASPAVLIRDSYPLSTYPVYATARPRTAVLHTAVGIDGEGRRHRLSLPVVADSDDPLIAEDRVADAVRDGRADDFCAAIAARLADPTATDAPDPLVAVEVVTEELDVVAVTADNAPPRERQVQAECPVGS